MTHDFIVLDPLGLHAKLLSQLVSQVGVYDSKLTLEYNGKTASLKSIMGLIALGVPTKAICTVRAEGGDEVAAIEKIKTVLVEYGISE
ncbi:HPr family phosphocarrier protein [Tannockella kyphosi]|uniref:HPr family phosphocarrier protein n=1 Tax=Tannockella kyphosi TaxID=2899121 RepID=UPI002011222E|nr:HPr family phosphocarrier protein [Tannockella kyphosi]